MTLRRAAAAAWRLLKPLRDDKVPSFAGTRIGSGRRRSSSTRRRRLRSFPATAREPMPAGAPGHDLPRRTPSRPPRGGTAWSAVRQPRANGRRIACGRVVVDAHLPSGWGTCWGTWMFPSCHRPLPEKVAPSKRSGSTKTKAPRTRGFRECAEEDSNLHPVIPDQALNLVTRLSYPSYASIASRTSTDLDTSDAMDDLDVAADVATEATAGPAEVRLARSGRRTRAIRGRARFQASPAARPRVAAEPRRAPGRGQRRPRR